MDQIKLIAAVVTLALGVSVASAATFTVTNTNDAGAGSLRDAVAQADLNPGADTVNFAVTGTITLTSGLIRIEAGPLTIAGPGAANLTIDGNLNSRIFAVIEGATQPACPALSGPADFPVTISGLTLRNASRNVANSSGGAIMSTKTLTLDSMIIRDNFAKVGGGVRFHSQYPGQTLTITNSQFIGNIAKATVAGNTGNYNGGALSVGDYCPGTRIPATVNISDSVFSGNRVQPDVLQGLGGAISIFENATATIARTRVTDNGIDVPQPPLGFSYPGGGIVTTTTSVTIVDSEISDNFAQNSGAISVNADNAALQTPASTFTFKLINSTIAGNLAYNGGGAMVLWANVATEIHNSTITNNLSIAFGSSGVQLSRPAGAFLEPTLALFSSVLGQARQNKADLTADIALIPATTVNATNTLIHRVCSTCGLTVAGSGNLLGTSPALGPLSFNGGTTRTIPLLLGSPAIDVGSNGLALPFDQRGAGFPRTVGAATDMGAYEVPATSNTLSAIGGGGQSARVGTSYTNPLVVRVLNASNQPAPGVTVHWTVPGLGASAVPSALTSQTNANGDATISVLATAIAGSYAVRASVGSSFAELALANTITATNNSCVLANPTVADLVGHYYAAILNRAGAQAERDSWIAEAYRLCQLGVDPTQTFKIMANAYFNSPEYVARNRSNSQYVDDLYIAILERLADAGAQSAWTSNLGSGLPRSLVLNFIVFSQEFTTQTQTYFGTIPSRPEIATVLDMYGGLFARLGDTGGINFWVSGLRNAQCAIPPAAAVQQKVDDLTFLFLGSAEYVGRNRTNSQFVQDLYYAMLQRGAFFAELSYWTGQLDNALLTREQIRQQFLASPEMQGRIAAIAAAGCLP